MWLPDWVLVAVSVLEEVSEVSVEPLVSWSVELEALALLVVSA